HRRVVLPLSTPRTAFFLKQVFFSSGRAPGLPGESTSSRVQNSTRTTRGAEKIVTQIPRRSTIAPLSSGSGFGASGKLRQEGSLIIHQDREEMSRQSGIPIALFLFALSLGLGAWYAFRSPRGTAPDAGGDPEVEKPAPPPAEAAHPASHPLA